MAPNDTAIAAAKMLTISIQFMAVLLSLRPPVRPSLTALPIKTMASTVNM